MLFVFRLCSMVEVAVLSPCNTYFLGDDTKREGAETVALVCVNMVFIFPLAVHHVLLNAFFFRGS